MNWPSLTVFIALFVFVTGSRLLGRAVARRRPDRIARVGPRWPPLRHLRHLVPARWRSLYRLHLHSCPALVYGAGAIGFFAVPYTVLIYPLLYLIFPRLWSLAHKHGYVTSSDVVLGRYGNKWLALAVGVTGIVATMPYIALQLVGMQVVIGAMGVSGEA